MEEDTGKKDVVLERMIREHRSVDGKIDRLREFLTKDRRAAALGDKGRRRRWNQLAAMSFYGGMLRTQIAERSGDGLQGAFRQAGSDPLYELLALARAMVLDKDWSDKQLAWYRDRLRKTLEVFDKGPAALDPAPTESQSGA